MLGGKKARDARIHVASGGSSLDNRSHKSKSSWSKYEWIAEVVDYFNLNKFSFYCDFYARANYDSVSVEASLNYGSTVPDSRINTDVKEMLQKAVNATGCPYEIDFDVDVYR